MVRTNELNNGGEDAGTGALQAPPAVIKGGKILAGKTSDIKIQVARERALTICEEASREVAPGQNVGEESQGRSVLHNKIARSDRGVAGEQVGYGEGGSRDERSKRGLNLLGKVTLRLHCAG